MVRGECVNPDGTDEPWCVVSESSCTRGTPAGRLATQVPGRGAGAGAVMGSAWDKCYGEDRG